MPTEGKLERELEDEELLAHAVQEAGHFFEHRDEGVSQGHRAAIV